MRTLVITAGDCLEPLLASSIPNLQFYCFAINVNRSNFEIDTDCRHEIVIENIILKTQKVHRDILNYLRQISTGEMIFQRLSFR